MTTALYPVANNARAVLATADSLNNTTSPITVSVVSGQGATFPTGATFPVSISSTLDPTNDASHELAMAVRTTDSFVLTRSSPVAHAGSPYLQRTWTTQDVEQRDTAINGVESALASLTAGDVAVVASGFSGNLSATDTDVQTALATIDAMVSGGGTAAGTTVVASGFSGYLSSADTDVQHALETLDTVAPGSATAATTSVVASGFAGNLSSADTTVQAALATLDAMTVGGGATPIYPHTVEILPWMSAISNVGWSALYVNGGVAPNTGDSGGTDTYMAGNAILMSSGAQNDEVVFNALLEAGTWDLKILAYKNTNAGIITAYLDATSIGTVDLYISSPERNHILSITGITVATTANYALKLKMASKNGSSSGYTGYIHHIVLIRTGA